MAYSIPRIDFSQYTNRQLAAVPLTILGLSILVLLAWFLMTGSPVNLGLPFVGGTEVRVAIEGSEQAARMQIQDAFSAEPSSVRTVAAEDTYVVTFKSGVTSPSEIQQQATAAGIEVLSVNSVSASFGASTQSSALIGIAVAFAAMSLLVFVLFRSIIPSIAVVISAFSDVVVPLAVMTLLGIPLNLGTVAALLMLIGYSVDSDILLNEQVLKQPGSFDDSVYRAMQTGVTMTLTSLSAMIVLAITAAFFGIDLLASIGLVLAIGLGIDLLNTYMLNLSLLRWYKTEGVKR